jgi:hypothetical protein
MSSSRGRRIWLLLFSLVGTACLSTSAKAAVETPTIEQVRSVVQDLDDGPVFPQNTKIEPLSLSAVGISAVWVRVYSRMPPLELVLMKDGDNSWRPLVMNKGQMRQWHKVLGVCEVPLKSEVPVAHDLAKDWALLIVDPNPGYFRILSSIDDIPVDMEQSSVYQESRRLNISDKEARSALERRCSPAISPPELSVKGQRSVLKFFYWHYFGGEVGECKINMQKPKLSRCKTVCTRVGSYDYYH